MKNILLILAALFAMVVNSQSQNDKKKMLQDLGKTIAESPAPDSDQTLDDCLTCPSYDYFISALSTYQTHASSIVSNGCKIYLIPVSQGSQYTFKTGCGDGATAAFDTYLELYDGSCNYITGNDDGCENARSIMTWTATYSGYAYCKVRGYNSSYYGSYTLAYKSDPWCMTCPSYDYSITPATSYQTHSSSISSYGCRIYYLNVTAGTEYTFKTGCGDGATADYDTYIELYNNSCSLLYADDDGCESNRSIITWTATYTGAAYLKVKAYSTYFGNYTISFRGYNPNLCKTCPSYDFTITPNSYFQTHSSSILSDGCKIYSVTVSSGKQYTFKTGCGDGATAGFDTFLELYDSGCSTLITDDDGCESNRSIITWTATYSGTVYLKVRGYSSEAYGSYTLAYNEIQPPNIWIGTYNYQWENPVNWNLGHVPTSDEDVYITSSGFQPCIIAVSNQECKSVEIYPGAVLAIDNKELIINGSIIISGALSMYNSSVLRVAGDWLGTSFTPGPGKVEFFGNQSSFILYDNVSFNILEVNKTGVNTGLFISATEVTCQQYNWIQGGVYVIGNGVFNAYDLTDNGIFGAWSASETGTINIYNYGGWVDLNGSITLTNGNMNVYGGSTYSYWPYVGNAEIHITEGVLDFKDQGIFINDNAPGYTLTENITGGTIRTSQGFIGNRADFTPSGGTFEFYGTSDYTISESNGCTLYNVSINKGAKEGEKSYPAGQLIDERSGMVISDGGKSNAISLASDFTITGNLTINSGSTFNLLEYDCNVAQIVDIYGILGITLPTDLSANIINWNSGSDDNITNGNIHVNSWRFYAGCLAHLGTGNTVYIAQGLLTNENTEFGNLVLVNNTKGTCGKIEAGKGTDDTHVAGNFTVQSGAWDGGPDTYIGGNIYIEPSASLFHTGNMTVNGDADISGWLDLAFPGKSMTVGGDFIFPSTAELHIKGGIFQCYSAADVILNGQLNIDPGSSLYFHQCSVIIGSAFMDDGILGGYWLIGGSLTALTPGNFQLNSALVHFTGFVEIRQITLATGNWLFDLQAGSGNFPLYLGNDLIVKGNLDVTDDFNLNGKTLQVDGVTNINNGKLILPAGSQLDIGTSLTISSSGRFESTGTSGNEVQIHGGSSGYYGFVVNTTGELAAVYTIFEDMHNYGIWIQNGAIVDPAASLNYCTFKNGVAGGSLLTVENTQDLSILSPAFPTNTWSGLYNITKTTNTGTIEMNGANGAFAGPAFENDPYSEVNWTGGMAGLWTGNVSSDWFNVSNWSSFTIPDAVVSVLIPPGCPNYPVVNGAQANCYNLTIDPGASLTIGNDKLLASNNVYISGNLAMTNSSGTLQGEDIFFEAGSTDNVTAGSIRCNNFVFSESTQVKLDGSNTVYCAWPTSYEYTAEFANLHIVPYSKSINKPSGKWPYIPVIITGDFVVEPGGWYDPQYDISVGGNTLIQGVLGDYSGNDFDLTCQGSLDISGSLRMTYSCEFLIHGNLIFTGHLTIFPDCEFTCDYNSPSGWTTLDGTLDLYPGSDFKITGANVLIGPSFNLIEQAPYPPYFNAEMVFGRSLSAPSPNFQVDHIYTSFTGANTGHYIELNAANYLLSLVLGKYPAGDYYLQSNITVKDLVSIGTENILTAYDKTIYMGGDWYENYYPGGGGFEPGTGRVVFNGTTDQTIYGQANFNTLEINKAGGQFVVPSGSTSICNSYDYTAGGIRVDGGTFTSVDMYDAFFTGNNQLTNGSLNISQDASQNLGLYGNLNISGGVMNVTCATQSFYWGFYENCNVTMNNGEMVVSAPEGLAIPGNYSGVFTENITGGTIKAYNELDVANPSFTPTGGNIELLGAGTTIVGMTSGSNVFNLVVNKTGTDDSGFTEKYPNESTSEDGNKANEVLLYNDLTVNGALTVAKGLLDLNSYDVMVSQSAMISNGGTLEVDAGAALLMASGQTLAVTEGGILKVLGTSGNEARVSHISSGNYTFNVDEGGTIGAQYGIFEYMGTNGIIVKTGSFVDAAYSFNNCTFRNGISGGRLLTVNNSQTFTANNAIFPANTWGGAYNVYKSVNSGTVNFVGATGGFSGAAFEYDPYNRINWSSLSFSLNIKAYLEGPFNGTNMNTMLNSILPLSHPFSPTLPYFGNPMPEWYYTGAGSVGIIPNPNIVDWVLVELRDAIDAPSATEATRFAQFPAFILNNGSIVALDGSSNLQFNGTVSNNLFIVIYHRNHQGIMNASAATYSAGTYSWDYTTGASQVYGGTAGHKQLASGKWGMRSGDGNGDGDVLVDDKTQVWGISGQIGKNGYLPSDFNFDRQTNNKDKNDKWFPNRNTWSHVPD